MCFHTIPFKAIPKIVLVDMIKNLLLWINSFPSKGEFSRRVVLNEMIPGIKINYSFQKQKIGSYVYT